MDAYQRASDFESGPSVYPRIEQHKLNISTERLYRNFSVTDPGVY